jgi:preprotein translocase subunit SecA
MQRIENPDVVYRTAKEKYFAVADEIERLHAAKQPVLVGTTSIEKSELLSEILKRKNVRHVVLNAKFHEKEAEIVAQAGRLGMVTISTNMAGRGTDILLGGNSEFMARQDLVKRKAARAVSAAEGAIAPVAAPGFVRFYYQSQEFEVSQQDWDAAIAAHAAATKSEHDAVIEAGGLHILGTERHESRRVDNQLRGRAGRQGDPGSSRFFLSLEDDLMRIFAREWVSTLLQSLGMEEGVPIESRMISKRIEGAQKAVESQNFESRKHVLEYDDVMNKQREAVYSLRRQLMEGVAQKQLITEDYVSTILSNILDEFAPEKAHPEQWNTEQIFAQVYDVFGAKLETSIDPTELNRHELGDAIFNKLNERYDIKEKILGDAQLRYHERVVMLSVLDALWKEHLLNMDHLKEGIGLRGYGQKDPLVEYKQESFGLFEAMMMRFQEDTARNLFRMQILAPDGTPIESLEQLAQLHLNQPAPPPAQQRLPIEATNPGTPGLASETGPEQPQQQAPPPTIPTRAPSTTIDALEREFQRNKQRDLAAARQAGGSTAAATATQRHTGAEIGRNDPCFCGSGKKYKKCHGASA